MPKPNISSGQRLLRNILLREGFGPIELEHGIAGYSVDLYLPRYHIGIEYDGPHHVLKYEEDLERMAEIVKAGLPILRISNREVKVAKANPKKLVNQVNDFISRRGSRE